MLTGGMPTPKPSPGSQEGAVPSLHSMESDSTATNILASVKEQVRTYFRIRMSFIARYVYTYEEFVFVTEASTVQPNDSDRTKNTDIKKKKKGIRNMQIDNCMYRYIMCKLKCRLSMCVR